MSAWRVLGAMTLLAVVGPVARSQTCNLAEAVRAGDCFRTNLQTKLSGEMHLQKASGIVPLKQQMTADHLAVERILAVATTGAVQKVARHYETAKASFNVGDDRFEKALRPDRRLIISQRQNDQPVVYSPAGAMTRTELEMAADLLDTAAVPHLLPGKEVAVGDTWKVGPWVVQALCNFEGVTEDNVTGRLDSVAGGVAVFRISGTATGIDTGALVKAKIDATGRFDVKARRVVALEWKQNDDREQGPASPAMKVETTITLAREAIAQPASLSDVALVSVPADFNVPASLLMLDHRDPQGRFALLYGREWHVSSATNDHLIMRLLDRGDFVAQVTVTPWVSAGKGQHMTPEEFKDKVNNLPGWEPEKELQAGEVPGQGEGRWVWRLSEQGKLDGMPVLQNFYVVAAPTGEQVVLVFTMTPKQVDKLGARDLSLVGSLDVPAPPAK
jgi:hypothetical protein